MGRDRRDSSRDRGRARGRPSYGASDRDRYLEDKVRPAQFVIIYTLGLSKYRTAVCSPNLNPGTVVL